MIEKQKILEIAKLLSEIDNHAQNINRPYTALISLAVSPAVLNMLLMNPASPFYNIYQNYFSEHYSERLTDVQAILANLTAADNLIQSQVTALKEGLEEMRTMLKVLIFKNKPISDNDVLSYIDENPGEAIDQVMINGLKKICIDLINQIGAPTPTGRLSYNFSKYKLKDICVSALKLSDHMHASMNKLPEMMARFLVRADFSQFTVFPKIILAILGERFIINPMLRYVFPYGVGQRYSLRQKELLAKRIDFLNKSEADELIKILKFTEKTLAKIARRNVLIARALIPIFIGLSLAYRNEEVSTYFWFLLITAISSATTGIIQESKRAYDSYTLPSKLAACGRLCRDLFKAINCSIETERNHNLASSIITIKFFDSHNLTAKQIRRAVASALIKHKVPIKLTTNQHIYLSASKVPSPHTIEKIRLDIDSAIERTVQLKKLQRQLELLKMRAFIIMEIEPQLEENFLKRLSIKMRIPTNLSQAIEETYAHLNLSKMDDLVDNPETQIIILEGFQPATDVVFDKLLDAVAREQKLEAEALRRSSVTHESMAFSSQVKKKTPSRSHVKTATSEMTETTSIAQKKLEIIEWVSGKYDPTNKENVIFPIKTNFGYGRIFAKFDLAPEDFPDSQSYHKFKKIITEDPTIVSRKGNQGLVFSAKQGPHGFFSLKAKSVDNMRVYAERKEALTGGKEALYVFNKVITRAH